MCASVERVASNNADISPTGAGNHLTNTVIPSLQDLSDAPTLMGEGREGGGTCERSRASKKEATVWEGKGYSNEHYRYGTSTAATAHPGHTAPHDPKSPTASLSLSFARTRTLSSPPPLHTIPVNPGARNHLHKTLALLT